MKLAFNNKIMKDLTDKQNNLIAKISQELAKLEENDPELEVSERTIRRELTNLGFFPDESLF